MSENNGITKQDLFDMEARLETRLTERITERIMERVGGRIDAVEERLKDYIAKADHDLETKIITEFHKWGRTSDMRTRQAITDTGLLGERRG